MVPTTPCVPAVRQLPDPQKNAKEGEGCCRDNLDSVIFKKQNPQTFDHLTITRSTCRVRTAAVACFFNFPEAKKEAYRGPERRSQLAKVTQQVKAEGKSFRSGPGHEDLLGCRSYLVNTLTSCPPSLCLCTSSPSCTPDPHDEMAHWGAPTGHCSCTPSSTCPSELTFFPSSTATSHQLTLFQ